jgi:hypothetical protein
MYLHTLAYVIFLTVLEPFVVDTASCQLPEERPVGKWGIEAAIRLIRMNQGLFDTACLEDTDHSFVSFASISTATKLCQAVMNDSDGTLLPRPRFLTGSPLL